jgi:hypothetical protein
MYLILNSAALAPLNPIAKKVNPSRVIRYMGSMRVPNPTFTGYSFNQKFDSMKDVGQSRFLPEHLSRLEAGGHGLVVLKDGHEVATS